MIQEKEEEQTVRSEGKKKRSHTRRTRRKKKSLRNKTAFLLCLFLLQKNKECRKRDTAHFFSNFLFGLVPFSLTLAVCWILFPPFNMNAKRGTGEEKRPTANAAYNAQQTCTHNSDRERWERNSDLRSLSTLSQQQRILFSFRYNVFLVNLSAHASPYVSKTRW